MEITVPTIVCQGCIDNLAKAISELDSNAVITGDVANKKLQVRSTLDIEQIKSVITSTGHRVD
jgi:copper chaperone